MVGRVPSVPYPPGGKSKTGLDIFTLGLDITTASGYCVPMSLSPATIAAFRLVDTETLLRQRDSAARNYTRSVVEGFPNPQMLEWFEAHEIVLAERA